MNLKIGSKISWVSAAGKLTGEIYNIVLDLNAAGQTIPWIDIKITGKNGIRMCASDDYLKQMKVMLVDTNMIERTNIMTGKKFLEPINTPVFMSPASESYWSM
jgi:hypothetical protein